MKQQKLTSLVVLNLSDVTVPESCGFDFSTQCRV